ncbi:hypothetical protein Tco_0142471, partial [Tanacetum coccineum]
MNSTFIDVVKDLKTQGVIQGTSLTQQERKCKLYDEFDKFTYKRGETLHEYYLRFTLLLNDMNIYKMPLEQFQDYAYLLWEDFIFKIETKSTKKGSAMYYPRFTKIVVNYVMEKDPSIPRRNKVNWHYTRDDPMFTTINVISRNEATQLYGAILPVAITNEDIRNSESYKEYYAMASGTKTKGSKKKANTDAIPKRKPPTAPKKQKTGTRKHKSSELENISEADLTEAEQLKIVIKRSRQETHSSHASGSGADEGTVLIMTQRMIYLGNQPTMIKMMSKIR